MKRMIPIILIFGLLVGCSVFKQQATTETLATQVPATPVPTTTETQTEVPPSATITNTASPSKTPSPTYPPGGYGPTSYPTDINPLTGLKASEASNLDRRPLAIKVNIVPRQGTRPPWGLSMADIVYEYYHNDGYTRFHAIFYGDNAELVGSIRSARYPDHPLIRMYKSIFAYGSADPTINQRLFNAEYYDRLVLEGGGSSLCPPTNTEPLCRFDPQGYDYLLGGTKSIHVYVEDKGVDDSRQNLNGMFFKMEAPANGDDAKQVLVNYSFDDYVRWDYDPASGKYLRFQDEVYAESTPRAYAPLTDRNDEQQIAAENVVVLNMEHLYVRKPPGEIIDITMSGSGPATLFRDGKAYPVTWNIPAQDSVLFLTDADGNPFPFKPGRTWFQVVGQTSTESQPETGVWQYQFMIP